MTADAVLASHFRRSPATRHTRKRCSWTACTKQNALLFCGSVAVVARLCGTVALVAGHENPNTYRPILDHRVGRARSPLRAGVGHAGPASRFESCFPRPYGRGYEPSENIRRAEDCPPYQEGRTGAVHSALDGEASIPFSVADTLLQCARNVSKNLYGKDAWPYGPAFLTQSYGHA